MSTNTKTNRVSKPSRDPYREKCFKDSYGLNAQLVFTNENDQDWNWVRVTMNVTDSAGKKYGLIEYYNDGDDNNTKYVDFEYEEDGEWTTEKFDTYIEAELALVDKIRSRLDGKSS